MPASRWQPAPASTLFFIHHDKDICLVRAEKDHTLTREMNVGDLAELLTAQAATYGAVSEARARSRRIFFIADPKLVKEASKHKPIVLLRHGRQPIDYLRFAVLNLILSRFSPRMAICCDKELSTHVYISAQ